MEDPPLSLEELRREYAEAVRRCDEGGNDGADVEEASALGILIRELEAKEKHMSPTPDPDTGEVPSAGPLLRLLEPSYKPGEILKLLPLIAAELGPIAKTERAPANMGGYPFRGIDGIVIGLAPLLHKHGVTVLPRVLEWSREQYANKDGKLMVNTMARVAYRFYAGDGSYLEAVVLGEASDAGDKSTPKAMTAAFKVALLQALTIPTGDDTEASGSETERGAAASKPGSGAPAAAAPAPAKVMKNGKPWPKWWRVGDKMLDRAGDGVFGVLTDGEGGPVDAEGILHYEPDQPMMSGGKANQWPTLQGSPFPVDLSCYQMLEAAIKSRRDGKRGAGDDPIAWVMATPGKGAYKDKKTKTGRTNWSGETAVALDFMADSIVEGLAAQAAAPPPAAAAPAPAPAAAPPSSKNPTPAPAPAPAAAPAHQGAPSGPERKTWKEGDPVPEDHDPNDDTCLCLMCVPF